MPPPEVWVVVAVGCWLAFMALKFAAKERPSFPVIGAVGIALVVAWCFVSFADLEGRTGDVALLLFIASGALGAWRGTVPAYDGIGDHDRDSRRVQLVSSWRDVPAAGRFVGVLLLWLIVIGAVWWAILSMSPDPGPSFPRRTGPPTPTASPPP